jgi:Protein of unknown function (DUF3106)
MARTLVASLRTVTLLTVLIVALPLPATAQVAQTTQFAQPSWSELKPQQKQILAPLAKDWDGLESFRRKKWLGIAQRYPTMKPEQQQRVSAQMKTWAAMSPEDRNQAREKFKKITQTSPEQRESRRQKWEQYQALPEDEKRKFREKAAKKQLPKHDDVRSVPRPLTRTATPMKNASTARTTPTTAPSASSTAATK